LFSLRSGRGWKGKRFGLTKQSPRTPQPWQREGCPPSPALLGWLWDVKQWGERDLFCVVLWLRW